MPEVTITIDGKKISAEEGANLLEVALLNGIEIPHLCHDPRIKTFGSCRLCFVETGGPRGPVAACGNTVSAGMTVLTQSSVLRELRKTALELLLSEHCGDCIAPCQLACPAHIDIQGYIAFIDRGDYKKAADLIKEKMPLPSICGRVCPRFCEDKCRRNLIDEPVNICDLKRFAGDYDLDIINSYLPQCKEDTGKEVAVVGGGPAGITAAYYLALEGHRVTLYDRGPKLGGMMRYGIPEYRLPKDLLDREVNLIAGICKEVHLGKILGRDFTIEELKEKYDAVFLGLGSQSAQGMGLEKEDTPGIYRGIEFLRSVAEGNPPELGQRVAVVGGGNTAMDAARTAVRLGAEEVYVVYRRSREEMPAEDIEIAEAEEEGVKFNFLTNPVSVLGDECVMGIECISMELGEPDESGRRRPIEVKGSEFKIETDNVIMAIGQTLDKENAGECRLELDGKNMAACSETGITPTEGVFAAGDAVTGPATVVEAVGAARRAVFAMNLYLEGKEVLSEKKSFNCSMGELEELGPEMFAGHEKIERTKIDHINPNERRKDFSEYNKGLNEADALKETKRCLSCGCQDVFDCELKKLSTDYSVDTKRLGFEKKRYPVNEDDPFIRHDPNKCILCASCVRICQEVQDANVLSLVNRGYETVVSPALELPFNEAGCESCGQCVSACPTGALMARVPFKMPGPWKDDRLVATTCVKCGTGCALELHITGEKISRITSPLRLSVNEGNLCVKGCFNYSYINSSERILNPVIKRENALKEVTWDEAFSVAGSGLKDIRDKFGSESVAMLISPELSNEETFVSLKMALDNLQVSYLGSDDPALKDYEISGYLSYEEVVNSDLIILADVDLPEDYPILAHKVRRAIDRGARLAVISEKSSRLDNVAGFVVPVNPGMIRDALGILPAFLDKPDFTRSCRSTENSRDLHSIKNVLRVNPAVFTDLATAIGLAKRPVFITDGSNGKLDNSDLLQEIFRLTGKDFSKGVLKLYDGGNTAGQKEFLRMILSDSGKESPKIKTVTVQEISDKVAKGSIRALIIVGEPGEDMPLSIIDNIFTVAIVPSFSDFIRGADVILPGAVFAETEGTVINSEGRLLPLTPALNPPGKMNNLDILASLNQAISAEDKKYTGENIISAIRNDIGFDLTQTYTMPEKWKG